MTHHWAVSHQNPFFTAQYSPNDELPQKRTTTPSHLTSRHTYRYACRRVPRSSCRSFSISCRACWESWNWLERKALAAASSSIITLTTSGLRCNTGTPQGTVLTPFIFTLYTADCRTQSVSYPLMKFADDNTMIGRIHNDDTKYQLHLKSFVDYCNTNYLQ